MVVSNEQDIVLDFFKLKQIFYFLYTLKCNALLLFICYDPKWLKGIFSLPYATYNKHITVIVNGVNGGRSVVIEYFPLTWRSQRCQIFWVHITCPCNWNNMPSIQVINQENGTKRLSNTYIYTYVCISIKPCYHNFTSLTRFT